MRYTRPLIIAIYWVSSPNVNGLAYASLFTFGFLFQTSCANQTRKRREISTHPNFDGRWKNDQIEWAPGQGEELLRASRKH